MPKSKGKGAELRRVPLESGVLTAESGGVILSVRVTDFTGDDIAAAKRVIEALFKVIAIAISTVRPPVRMTFERDV